MASFVILVQTVSLANLFPAIFGHFLLNIQISFFSNNTLMHVSYSFLAPPPSVIVVLPLYTWNSS